LQLKIAEQNSINVRWIVDAMEVCDNAVTPVVFLFFSYYIPLLRGGGESQFSIRGGGEYQFSIKASIHHNTCG